MDAPRSKHWHLIDYVLVRKKDRQDVCVTKSMCGADCWTDHRLIISKMKIRIFPKRRPQGKGSTKAAARLKTEESLSQYRIHKDTRRARRTHTDHRQRGRQLGLLPRHCICSSSRESWPHPAQAGRLHRVYLRNNSPANKAAFSNIRSMVQSRLRQMQDSWLSQKAEEIQHYADTKDMKRLT